MNRKDQKTIFRVTIAALLIAGLGMLAGCGGGGGGGGAAPPTAPGAFSMTAPANNALSIVPTPTLSWNGASGATTYTVEVNTSPTFSMVNTFESTTIPAGTTSIVASSLSPSTVYYWRVIALNSVGTTTASGAPFSFTTKKSGDVAWSQMNDPSFIDDQSYGMAISGANMYVVGYDSNTTEGDDQWHIEKRTLHDGSLVASFGTTTPGVVVNNPSGTTINSFDDAYAVAVDSTALYVVGFDSAAGDYNWGWRIEKRDLVTGASITAFGSNGAISENVSGFDDAAYAVAVDSSPTGTMYIVGYESTVLQGTEWRIEARDKATGTLVSSVTSSISADADVAYAIAIDTSEGYMYVVGTESSAGNSAWRIEKRSLSAPLSLETFTFGSPSTPGYIYSNPNTTGQDAPLSIALDSTYMYVAGYDTTSGVRRWRIEKRLLSDGSLETTSFGIGGYVNSITTTSAVANAIAIDSNYMYIAGYDNTLSGFLEWRIEKRDLITGDLVSIFGSGGVVVNDFGSPALDHDIWTIAVDASYVYVAGYESVDASNSRWRIEKIVK